MGDTPSNTEPGGRASLLAHPPFKRFWLGETASTLGYQMLVIAIGWQMYEITDSALSLGLIGLTQFFSLLLFALPAGHTADRYDRRRVATLCQLVQCLLATVLMAGTHGAWLDSTLLYACAFALGACQAFQSPTMRAMLPALIVRGLLSRGIAWTSAAKKAAVIIGPALGGLIYLVDASAVYGTSAAFFGFATIFIGSIRVPGRTLQHQPVTLNSLFAGIAYIRSHPVILGAITLDLFATLLGGATALLPIYARDILDAGPGGLGLLRSAPAVGALLVSAYLVKTPLTRGVGRVMLASIVVFGVGTIVFGVSRSLPLSLAALAVMGAADMVSVVIRQSLVQLETPDDMRGRVSAVNSLCTGTSNHLGQFQSGITAAWLGTVPSVVIGGLAVLLVVVLWKRWFPEMAGRESLVAPASSSDDPAQIRPR